MDFRSLRPGFPVHPPAVARHLAFHLSTDENPNRVPDDEPRRKKWKDLCNRLAEHINALRAAYGLSDDVSFVQPDEDPGDEPRCYSLGGSCIVPINRPGSVGDYRLRVRIDVHTELFSFTYILDEIGWDSKDRLADKIGRLLDSSNPERQFAAVQWLFNGMWKPNELLCAADIVAWRRRPGSRRGAKRPLGQLITDFRGVIVYPDDDRPPGLPQLEETAIREGEARGRLKELDDRLAKFAKLNEALIREIADSQPEAETTERGEAVVCGLLEGKALYAAALGEWSEDDRIQPIRHLLVYAGASYAQLGRLLRRMHILGELRHAALIDYDPDSENEPLPPGQFATDEKKGLRDASRAIAVLGHDLNARTHELTTETDSPIEKLQEFVSDLAAISQMVDGGLTYRVEQSRYYASEFLRTIKHLRVTRVSDWQAYDDFVERYILHLFARIDRIGNRYEALGRRLDRLLFFAQAKLLDSYTKSVDDTVHQIEGVTNALRKAANRQAETLGTIDTAISLVNRSARQQIAASRQQVGLLEVAELFAAIFLLYYVGTVFDHLFQTGPETAHEAGLPLQESYRIAWAVLIGVPGLWLLSRIVWRLAPRTYRHLLRRFHYLWLSPRRRRLVRRIGRALKPARSRRYILPWRLPGARRREQPLRPPAIRR
ncbi:MAG TPA: hypothetical protein VGW40_00060 [Allosphingosinicella sp.]|nr:hypothetical protein [Allosphingosinicella sp.]